MNWIPVAFVIGVLVGAVGMFWWLASMDWSDR